MNQIRHRRVWTWGMLLFVGGWLFVGGACSPPKVACKSDSDCQAPASFCVSDTCRACRTDADCKGRRCTNGNCTAVQEFASEPKSEPKSELSSEASAETTTPDEPVVSPEDSGSTSKEDLVEATPESEVVPEVVKETPPEPKVVKPPTLPKASSVCGSSKNCCVPVRVGRPIQEHTPVAVARSLWTFAAWSKDHKWMAYASADSPDIVLRKGTSPDKAYVYNKTLSGQHLYGILVLVFSPDGKYLASAGYDRRVIVWRLSDGKRMYQLGGHRSTIYKMAFSPDSSMLVSVGSYDRGIRIWRMSDGRLRRAIRAPSPVWSVSVSTDNKTLATGLDNSTIMLWDIRSGKSTKTMTGHSARVRSVAFGPNGKRLISGSDDNRLRLWNLSTGKTIRAYLCGGDIYTLGFSPDGKTLAGGCTDRTVRVWDASSATQKHILRHQAIVSSVRWSGDSKYLLSGSYAKTLRIWDANTGNEVRSIFTDQKVRALVAYDPAGKVMAYVAVNTNDILLVRLSDNKLLFTLKGHTRHITDISVSQNGQYLVSGSADGTAKVWRLSDGKMVYDLKRHKDMVFSVAIDPNNKWIATGGQDNTLNLWQLSDGKWSKEIKVSQGVRAVAWNSDGRYIALGVGKQVLVVRVSDSTTTRTLSNARGPIETLDWSAKTSRLAAGSWDRNIYVWNAINGSLINSWLAHSYAVTSVAFDADGKDLASSSYDLTMRIWNPDNLDRKQLNYGHVLGITSLVYGPGKNTISTASWDGTVRIWRTNDPSRVIQVGEKVLSISVSQDDLWIAAGMENGTVGIWRLKDGKKIGDFEAHEEIVRSVAFSPSGDILATTSDDRTIKLWDVRGGTLLRTLKGHLDRVYKARFNSDGKILATVSRDTSIRLWDPATGKLLQKITGARGALLDVAFSPNGKYIAAASFSGLVYVWDTSDYSKVYASFRGHLGGALAVVFRNNNELLSGSLDSRIRHWRLSDKRALRNAVGHNGPVLGLALRPGSYYYGTASEDGTIRSWQMVNGLLISTGLGHKGPVNSIGVTRDGRWVSGSSDGTIRIWNSLALRVKKVSALRPYGITAVTLSRDGTRVISVAADRRTRLRRLSDYRLLRTFYGTSKTVRSVDISGDNATVAFGSDDTYVRAYRASNGASIFVGKHPSSVTATMFAYDNKTIITGTEKGLIKVWDLATRKSIKDITGHQGKIHTLNRSKDGKVWMSASTQGPIQLWQTSDGKKLRSWPKQGGDILSAALSGNADKVAAAIGGNTIKVWQVSDGKELKSITTSAGVLGVRFGGEGAWLAASLKDSTIVMWETKTYKPIAVLRQGNLPLYGLHSLSNGSYLSAGDSSGMLYLWQCP